MNRIQHLCLCVLFLTLFVGCSKTQEQEIPVESVSLSQPTAEMIIGETAQLHATVLPSNATEKTVQWTSSKQSVATVTSSGLVTAIAEGVSTITTSAGGKSASCLISVSTGIVVVSSITLNKTSLELVEGESETLAATVNPHDASDKTVTWDSTNASVASVDNGKINAIKEGTTTITAKAGDKTAECRVSVAKKEIAVTSIELNKTILELVEGDSETLIAIVRPDDATNKTVTWSSAQKSVATVDESGNVCAVAPGETSITAKAGEQYATCVVTVKKNPANEPIAFADSRIKEKLVAAFDTNGDGELSYSEANSILSIQGVFDDDTSFLSFDEFQFFTKVTEIPDGMFRSWSQLESIVLPGSIVSIGKSAFNTCLSLKSINLPDSVQSIGDGAFSQCVQLNTIIIPKTISIINNSTFSECISLESITLPNGLTSIGWSAFSNCKKLKAINLPDQLKTIGVSAFCGSGLESIVIPSCVEVVNISSFEDCSLLSAVSFSNPKTEICTQAFKGCTNLVDFALPTGIKLLPFGVFWGCTKLNTIIIPDSVSSIGDSAFWGCGNLERIIIPKTVVQIGSQAFYRCSKLTSVIVLAPTPPILGNGAFFIYMGWDTNYHYPDHIYVPQDSIDSYKNSTYWKLYSEIIFPIEE